MSKFQKNPLGQPTTKNNQKSNNGQRYNKNKNRFRSKDRNNQQSQNQENGQKPNSPNSQRNGQKQDLGTPPKNRSNPNRSRNNFNQKNQRNNQGQRNFNNRRGNNNRYQSRNGQKLNSRPTDQSTKLNRLFDDYQTKRRYYFENFHKLNDAQKMKLENEIHQIVINYRSTENYLKERYAKRTQLKVSEYPQDLIYSSNHQITEEELKEFKLPSPEEIVDPHISAEQLHRPKEEFMSTTDDSVGTMDDYLKFRSEKPLK